MSRGSSSWPVLDALLKKKSAACIPYCWLLLASTANKLNCITLQVMNSISMCEVLTSDVYWPLSGRLFLFLFFFLFFFLKAKKSRQIGENNGIEQLRIYQNSVLLKSLRMRFLRCIIT